MTQSFYAKNPLKSKMCIFGYVFNTRKEKKCLSRKMFTKKLLFTDGPSHTTPVNLNRTDVTSHPYVYRKCPGGAALELTCHVSGVLPEPGMSVSMWPPGTTHDVTCPSSDQCSYRCVRFGRRCSDVGCQI